jgi:hypothetical protein
VPFATNSLKARVEKSKNSEGEERLQIRLSGELLQDTNVDWYYLTFRAIIEGESSSHDPSIFLANTYYGGAVPLIDYKQGYFSEPIVFETLDYLPEAGQNVEIVLDAVAYKGKSWYDISSENPSGNSISELEDIGISKQDINNQLSKSIQNMGFIQNKKLDPKRDDREVQIYELIIPSKFNKRSSDKITNFNPSTDTLEINTDSFSTDSSATFATGKNKRSVKKRLAKKDFDFLYDQKEGGLYFNENGADKGFGDGGIIAILKGAPDLTSENIEFV